MYKVNILKLGMKSFCLPKVLQYSCILEVKIYKPLFGNSSR